MITFRSVSICWSHFVSFFFLFDYYCGSRPRVGGGGYVGEFRDGNIEGKGTYKFSDGTIYHGNFDKGLRSGFGEIRYADGATYTGEWKDNWREGKGKQVESDGSTFEGTFKGDSQWSGTLTFADGTVRTMRNGRLTKVTNN